jgi:hypothetical protein
MVVASHLPLGLLSSKLQENKAGKTFCDDSWLENPIAYQTSKKKYEFLQQQQKDKSLV